MIELRKTRAHQTYRLADGTRVPGVTTIIGVMDKPALVRWANRLGLDGIDATKHRDVLADMGTLAHGLVEADLLGEDIDTGDYSPREVEKAMHSMAGYREWRRGWDIEVLGCEMQLVSEQHRYGGTLDLYLFGGPKGDEPRRWLLDIKTGKGLYPENDLQIAALRALLEETGHQVDRQMILRIPRDAKEGTFEAKQVTLLPEHMELFLACRQVYGLRRRLGWR